MKKTQRVFLMILLVSLLVFTGAALAYAEQDQYDSYSEIAANSSTSQQLERELPQKEPLQTPEANSHYSATVDFDKILNYIHVHPESEFALHYGGAFIDIDGILVIRLTCQDGKCKQFLEDTLLSVPCKYEYSEKSFLPFEELYLEMAEKISNLNTKIINNEDPSEEEILLAKRYPALDFDERQNTITVLFSEDANTENLPPEIYLSQCQQLFEAVIGQFDVSHFRLVPQSDLLFDSYSSEARPGQGLAVKKYVNGSWVIVSICSLGYRVHYTSSSGTINGFITCGHGVEEGDRIYIGTVYLGDI